MSDLEEGEVVEGGVGGAGTEQAPAARAEHDRDAQPEAPAAEAPAAQAPAADEGAGQAPASATPGAAEQAGAAGGAADLPPGWKQHWSRTKDRPFYRFGATGETTWERPSRSKLAFGHGAAPAPRSGGENAVMKELGVALKSHSEVETRVIAQLEAAAREREEEQEKANAARRLGKIQQLQSNVAAVLKKLASPAYSSTFQQSALKEQLKELQAKLAALQEEEKQATRSAPSAGDMPEAGSKQDGAVRLLDGARSQESERERMIRTGLITPFDGRAQMERVRIASSSNNAAARLPNSGKSPAAAGGAAVPPSRQGSQSLQPPRKTGAQQGRRPAVPSSTKMGKAATQKRQRGPSHRAGDIVDDGDALAFQARLNEQTRAKRAKQRQREGKSELSSDDDDLYLGAESHPASARRHSSDRGVGGSAGHRRATDSGGPSARRVATRQRDKKKKPRGGSDDDEDDDDSDWLPEPRSAEEGEEDVRGKKDDDYSDDWDGEELAGTDDEREEEGDYDSALDDDGEVEKFDGGYQIPACIWHKLFPYQRTAVQWMWELHCQEAGGIVGDEMGLGKTIQIIAFLAGLHRSGKLDGPVILLCPATIMRQWVREFQKWYPPMRVVLLHSSGSTFDTPKQLIRDVEQSGGVIVTTYEQMRRSAKLLTEPRWSYAILDEGHKIRNPDADVTQAVKGLDTPHRLLLSGSPIQNKLVELWSLFDFIFPGRLGTLPIFQTHFEVPIAAGGFANASKFQVETAYKCALELRELIDPYLLRRVKSDVALQLPDKQEQVLFCQLTKKQRRLYERALSSPEVLRAMEGSCKVFGALTLLRKICNHPDLQHVNILEKPDGYGCPTKSTKMQLLEKILPLWREQGHRVLLFTQTKQMLDILEKFIQKLAMTYRRMDGDSNIKTRIAKIDEFNRSSNIFCFLLTTRVGGLGTNLTGANRVIIYDPDWNPSTDLQARERSWRIGQTRDVVIYRLLVSGTIEEKIYHRQIFKQFLTNKILKDPTQRRFFKTKDLMDLFTLGNDTAGTETGDLFADVADEMLPGDQSDEESYFNSNSRDEGGGAGGGIFAQRSDNGGGRSNDKEPADERGSDASSMRGGEASKDKKHANADQTSNVLDGVVLPGVEVRNHRKDPSGEGVESEKKKETDMLRQLLSSKSITSAISHDSIMNNQSGLDDGVSRKEAAAIAQKAAAALKLSAQQRMSDPVNVPTWTGRAGLGGAPAAVREAAVGAAGGAAGAAAKPRFGTVKKSSVKVGGIVGSLDGPALKDVAVAAGSPHVDASGRAANSTAGKELEKERGFGGAATCGTIGVQSINPGCSQELLKALRDKGLVEGPASMPGDEDDGENWALVMMRDLSDFLSRRYKPPTTGEILDRFRERVPYHRQELFRTCLKQVAEVEKREKRPGVWWIRDVFRTCTPPKRARGEGGSAASRGEGGLTGDARQRNPDVGSCSNGRFASSVEGELSSKEAGKRRRSSSAGGQDSRGSSAPKRPSTSAKAETQQADASPTLAAADALKPNVSSSSAGAQAQGPLIIRIKTEGGGMFNGGAIMKETNSKKVAAEIAYRASADTDKGKAMCMQRVEGEDAGCGGSSAVSNKSPSMSLSSCSDNSDMADDPSLAAAIAASLKTMHKPSAEVQKGDVIVID